MKILITGGTNGIGKGVARALAAADNRQHEIIILGRSKTLCEATVQELEQSTGNKKLSFVVCDLAKLKDVKAVISEIKSRHTYLDAVFINAGLGYAPRQLTTEDGMDPHFQVNYLSQFMLTLHLLGLLQKSVTGGRVLFNVTEGGKIYWDDLQMRKGWGYVRGIRQAMVAKRMLVVTLHKMHRKIKGSGLSFTGFQVPKTVWSNQVTIIPFTMRLMAGVMKFFGQFMSIEKCGAIMAPLFTAPQELSLLRSGKFITWRHNRFTELKEDAAVLDSALQERLWNTSIALCNDEETVQVAKGFSVTSESSQPG